MTRLGLALLILTVASASPFSEITGIAPAPADDAAPVQLLNVRRVHVEKLAGGETAHHIRDMVIASLQRSGLFQLTENPDRADAILRGSAEDMVFTDTFQSSERIDGRVSAGMPLSANGTTRSSSASNRRSFSAGVGESESVRIAERKHEAAAAVRLVNRDGDVIWSTTQESLGAKFRGASADVADKITRQLLEDVRKARLPSAAPTPGGR